jgi:hypothetical protein
MSNSEYNPCQLELTPSIGRVALTGTGLGVFVASWLRDLRRYADA